MIFSGLVKKVYKKMLFRRMDERPDTFYFTAADFDGLKESPYPFKNVAGQTLAGHFYSYDDPRKDRIVVFEHGMAAGHRNYLREIETICRHGYLVFTYDRTGCADSEGDSTLGFSGALADADCAIQALRADERYKNMEISVVGHSWGGYTAQNISAFHKDLRHVVAISGFPSVALMLEQQLGGLLKFYRKDILELELATNGKYAASSTLTALDGTDAKALFIHSTDDHIVAYDMHMKHLIDNLSDNGKVTLVTVSGKRHNPTYTEEAVKLLAEYNAKRGEAAKKKLLRTPEEYWAFVDSFDWWAMTEQDETVWNRIFELLDN